MLAKRIIPCLDVTGGRVVKGVNFLELRDAGDPVEIAARYNAQGADELTFLDITATSDGRDLILPIIEAVASQVFIPLTVGGGVRTVEDVRRLLNAGADKTSFNSAAIANPGVIDEVSHRYGAQCIVVAIDAKRRTAADAAERGPGWDVYSHGGRKNTGLDVVRWAAEMARRTRTSSSGFLALLMARMVLAREPARMTWNCGLPLNCATMRVPARGKTSTSPAISAAACAALSEMKRKVTRLILAWPGLR